MGKYMKKSKITSDVTVVMESASLGVRTRAKTLADSSYLQLRNRRLEKPSLLIPNENSKKLLQHKQKHEQLYQEEEEEVPCFDKKLSSKGSSRMSSRRSFSTVKEEKGDNEAEGCFGNTEKIMGFKCEAATAEDFGVEVSFGDNYLDFESSRERSTRESTPCNLVKDSDSVETPGSTTRRGSSTTANQRVRINMLRNIPTSHEMEEFFACAEQRQQRLFIEKYNFDVVNDLPLPGRYEWVQVIP